MYFFIILLALVLIINSPVEASDEAFALEKIRPVAEASITKLSKLVNEKNYRVMGFETPDEVRRATLGEPLRIFMVRLDQLKQYQPGSDPNQLLSGGEQVIYPVVVEGQVRSSIKVEMIKGTWQPISYGGAKIAKLLSVSRKSVQKSTKLPETSHFVVRVPALNLYFLGYRANGVLMLTPILDYPAYDLKAGVTKPADKVFETILPAAKKHNGLPR